MIQINQKYGRLVICANILSKHTVVGPGSDLTIELDDIIFVFILAFVFFFIYSEINVHAERKICN